MTSWMQNLFSLSAAGGLLALLLMALKPLYRDRITRAVQYYVWLLVLARLVLPVTLGLGVLGGLAPDGAAPQADGNLRWEGNLISDGISPDSPSGAAPEARPLDLSRQSLLPLLPWLWGAGAGVTLLVHGVGYGRFCHRVRRRCTPADAPTQALVLELWGPRRGAPEVFFSPLVPTPMLVGLLRPRVYLPEDGYAPGQLRDILLHELTHLRRHDLLVKWAALLVQAVHWFNPVLYLARRELNHACELACDEAVVRGMDREERIRYGQTLLSAAARARPPRGAVSATLCEEKARMRERLHALATRRERSLRTACLSALLVLVLLGTSVALGACAPQGTAPPAPTENPPQTASPPGNTTPAVSSEAQIRRWLGDHYAPGGLLSQAAEEEALAAFASYLQNTSWQADRYYGAQLTGRAEDGLPLLTLLSRDELGLSAGDSYYLDADGAVQVGPSGRVDTPGGHPGTGLRRPRLPAHRPGRTHDLPRGHGGLSQQLLVHHPLPPGRGDGPGDRRGGTRAGDQPHPKPGLYL